MGMDTLCQLLHSTVHGNQNSYSLYRARSIVAYHTHAENLHIVIVGREKFYKALGIAFGNGAGYRAVFKGHHFVFHSFLLGLRLVQPHAGHFRGKEHNRADVLVHQLTLRLAKDALRRIASFQFSHVHQRDVGRQVAYRIDVGNARLGIMIFDSPFRNFDSYFVLP